MPAYSIFFALARLCGVILVLCISLTAQIKDYTRWVDPFIGTGGHGHTFPGAVMPFGMVQLSPDTREANWDGSSGYHYSDDIIYGFSHTHLSGTGIPDGCDVLLMPTIGEPQSFAKAGDKSVNGYASKFSHANEKAEPGYYSVRLDDDGVLAEVSTTQRVGLHRYTFPESSNANIIIDLTWRDTVLDSGLNLVGKNRVEGFRRSSSWAKNQTIYFVAEFSKPFDHRTDITHFLNRTAHGEPTGEKRSGSLVTLKYKTRPAEKILVKVAISSVSIEGARKNLKAELPGWDFDKVRADAKKAWNKELSKIEVSGGTDAQTTTFYTALYHTMIHPSIFNDVDGNYRGLDGKTHNIRDERQETGDKRQRPKAKDQRPSDQYTVFSLWDTFRAAHPLYTIIDQKRAVDFINSFIRMYEQGGRLPVWELWGNETDTMIGYHAVSVIADAMAKGIKGFDYEKAYKAAKHSAELDHFGLAAYKKRGYISMEDENESVSKTLEYAYNDWCITSIAAVLYNEHCSGVIKKERTPYCDAVLADFGKYDRRATSFANLFDKSTGFMRPRKNGGFVSPFAPNEVTFNFTEGNSWVYSFFVPQDISSLMRLDENGGPATFASKLDRLFTTSDKLTGREQPDITGLIGQYAHGNEPSHHIAYLYDYVGQPSKTQKYVRRILDEFYKPTPDGLIGNEDCGQMSAWYVLSASGFYPVRPGGTHYDIGTPIFREITYHLENGKKFTIKAHGVSSTNIYIRSARWNGSPHEASFITHGQIMSGGVIEFEMNATPDDSVFKILSSSSIGLHYSPAVPIIGDGSRVFRKSYAFTIKSVIRNTRVFYTLDGSEPTEKSTLYTEPITIAADTTVKAIAIHSLGKSQVAEAHYHRLPNDWTVKIDSKYNRQYTGGGDEGLIDGIRGSTNFASGEWQGYQAQDLVATIDLQKETEITTLAGSFLQVAQSWIWAPTRVEFETSLDGVNFVKFDDMKSSVPPESMEPTIYLFSATISDSNVKARYVRVRAYNLGKIPAWHPGAGDEAFIFVDEIFVN